MYPDFHCDQNDKLLITGPSGSGKSTLMHLLAGFLKPQTGQIEIFETSLNDLTDSSLAKFRANNIGIVYQDNYFIQALSIKENFILAQSFAGNKKDISKIERFSKLLEIDHLLEKRPQRLSRGEQQRASIVRALINEPKLILADEPTSSLDDNNCNKVIDLLEELSSSSNASLIVVTHDSRLKSRFQNQLRL